MTTLIIWQLGVTYGAVQNKIYSSGNAQIIQKTSFLDGNDSMEPIQGNQVLNKFGLQYFLIHKSILKMNIS